MEYSKWQLKYINSIEGKPHDCAVKIIGEMERALEAKDNMLVAYRTGGKIKEKTLNALQRWKKFDSLLETIKGKL